MDQRVVKTLDGKAYEWDGTRWAGQNDQMVPPSGKIPLLQQMLTVEDWGKLGKVPPVGPDEEQAVWHRNVARSFQGPVPRVFCWACGGFIRPPRAPWSCSDCGTVSFKNRKHCHFCGANVEPNAICTSCHREDLDPLAKLTRTLNDEAK